MAWASRDGRSATACRRQSKQPRPTRAASKGWYNCAEGLLRPISGGRTLRHSAPAPGRVEIRHVEAAQCPSARARRERIPMSNVLSLQGLRVSRFGDVEIRGRCICEYPSGWRESVSLQ